ncbi:RodZ domain-containing protein [Proteinivorax hydrogeniformans]|uniref:RodZ domain-containing protein n=1 Tax=Proteinivorax hydrogeniformans TaxID=1826727 RepID=A0AAU8HNS1_9FIRM
MIVIKLNEIGQTLQSTRKEKGLTIEDISLKTKIKKQHIVAIEEGDEKALPPRTYLLGFIKLYAKVLELDIQDLLDITPTVKRSKPKRKQQRTQPINRSSTKSSFDLKGIIFILTFIFIIGFSGYLTLGYLFSSTQPIGENNQIESPTATENGADDVGTSEDKKDDEDNKDDDEVEKPIEEDEKPQLTIEEDNTETDYYYYLSSQEPVELKLIFSEPCWVRVTVGDEIVHENTHNLGDSFEVELEKDAKVRIGNPQGVQFVISDVEVDFFEDNSPKEAHFKLVTDEE